MRTFSEKLKNDYNDILKEYCITHNYKHIIADLKLNDWTYIFSFYNNVYEELGTINNGNGIVSDIISELNNNNFSSFKYELNKYQISDNIKFININIINNDNLFAEYDRYDHDTLYINIYGNIELLNDSIEFGKLIIHELLHGYEDIERISNGKDSIFKHWNDKYKTAREYIRSHNYVIKNLAIGEYFFNYHERLAYMSGLDADVKKFIDDNNITTRNFNYTSFKNSIIKTEFWNTYFKFFKFVEELSVINNKSDKDEIEKWYKRLFKEDKKFNTITKEFIKKWNKFEQKFNTLLPKLICKYIKSDVKSISFPSKHLNENYILTHTFIFD